MSLKLPKIRYETGLILRLIPLLIPISFFNLILRPLTIYGVYLFTFFLNPRVIGDSLFIGEFNFIFSKVCIAGGAYFFLMLLILTTKDIDFKKRFYCFLTGSLGIFIMNVLRIFILVLIRIFIGKDLFDNIHILFWSIISGVYIALVWIALVKIFKIKSIPIYDDLKYLYKKSYFAK